MNELLAPVLFFLQALVIILLTLYIVASFILTIRGSSPAKMKLTEGIILGLSLQTAVAILNTLRITSWNDIAYVAILISMRMFLKLYETSFKF